MAVVVPALPALSRDLALFHTTDPLLSNLPVLVFHGPAATIGATSSRIQVHIFTPAGIGSYARLAVSPNSPFYSAVSNLPREEQGDEVCRGLAFGLKKYFAELPETVKQTWCTQVKAPSSGMLFGDDHIAVLASRMTRIENVEEVIGSIADAYSEQRLSWLDVDVVLPPGSIKEASSQKESSGSDGLADPEALQQRYGRYAELIGALGDAAFLPTSKMKRAPSKATTVGRSTSFLRHQRESVRMELCELLDTEESYVGRMKDLHEISGSIGADLKASSQLQLRAVFPEAINAVLAVNTQFVDEFRALLERTESAALQDIEDASETAENGQQTSRDSTGDAQGIAAVAKCLCDWLPRFADPYGQYVRFQAQSAQRLRSLFRTADTALLGALQEVGEQRLTSLLIEPIQRLPRYTLYIDSIAKQLPARHPAMKALLKARDIVSDICTQDDAAMTAVNITDKLRSRVSGWPADCEIAGRLVAAVDVTELAAPFALQGYEASPGMILIFTDSVLLLEKVDGQAITGRALQSELENGSFAVHAPTARPGTPHDLRYVKRVKLDACEGTESHGGRVLQLFTRFTLDTTARPAQQPRTDSCHVLRLEGAYEGKAVRLVEEIVKAKIESRYSEAERESSKWEVRASDLAADYASLLSAVFEDSSADFVATRHDCASIRVLVDIDKHSLRPRAGQNGVRTVIALSPVRDGLWRVTIDSVDGIATRDLVAVADVTSLLGKRLATLTISRFAIEEPSMTACLLGKFAETIASLDLQVRQSDDDEDQRQAAVDERLRRPKSPRKLLANFLSSTGPGSQPPAFMKKDLPPLPPPGQLPRTRLAEQMPSKPPSRESRPSSKDQATPRSLTSMRSTDQLSSSHRRFEETFSAYVLALQSRKGNIVGRSLKMRAAADQLAVNELYNSLLEDPNMMVLAAQATVDVLFAAFEKFLNVAWREQVGPIVPFAVMQSIQAKAETLFPTDFDEYFRSTLSALPPQNQRAFKAIMKLLADLLDGTGNDGDRGVLTAAFAEVLVTEGNPRDFIALIDRFVDDTETYFGEPLEEAQRPGDGPGSIHKRARSVNSASISSNTSSLRKKFGFGTLSRANSKSEEESKVTSVWRTLSKSTRGGEASPANSVTRATLARSHSTDIDARGAPLRLASQEGPTLKPSAFEDVAALTGPASTQNLGLSTIGEHPSFIPTGPPRKKRRSSLSDLKALNESQKLQPWMSPSPRRPGLAQRQTDDKSLPASPMPSTPSSKGGSGKFGSPLRETPRSRLPSSFRKENSPSADKAFGVVAPLRPRSSSKQPDEVIITSRPTSSIPTLAPKTASPYKVPSPAPRVGLSERAGAGNIVKRPSPPPEKPQKPAVSALPPQPTPTKKLRMQSPQKLRERLQNEQSSLTAAQTSLQDELSKIGDELTATPSRIGSIRTPLTGGSHVRSGASIGGISSSQPSTMDLAQRVLKMEGHLAAHIDAARSRLDAVQAELSTSLTVSENKCRKLDELYREANGENEALYARFNDELGRVLKAVKGGEGVEELRRKVRESQEEAARLKREGSRLKRENVGLRAQLRE
ncbi:hypothetical protein B0A55_00689 [Friedmanniomyces simplex]|uniref:DH domain-containing protein n=1 Tax=Friedmanniomyces simplex TaxID=329884 RepID=A0A4U0XKR5_9PEZI|nr:hypothetical protein B0A55_04551 [Friedmanniomyces simplex]TKA83186.1 hypothetical protein B0A55_00689 [Friedmanniomyces simplex]